jgi:Putative peptidoglycan binding domain
MLSMAEIGIITGVIVAPTSGMAIGGAGMAAPGLASMRDSSRGIITRTTRTTIIRTSITPGYYANVEPYYNDDGVYNGLAAADPTVTAIQTDLTTLGYYHGTIGGLYGRDTRDAVARYQSDHKLTVTGTLTAQTLQSLGVNASGAS